MTFFRGATGLSHVPPCFELILRVTVESVQGCQVYLEWRLEPEFLSNADMDLGVPLEFPQGSQASSHVQACKSALLSSWKSSVSLPVELT